MAVHVLEEKYWWRWRDCVAARRYREWKEIQDDLAAECEYAIQNDMETEFWCLKCKHSECDEHKQKHKCAGKTQRGRNCHFPGISFVRGNFYCCYHRKW